MTRDKEQPSIEPRASLSDALVAAYDDPEARRRIEIMLLIRGGSRSSRYVLEFRMDGTGRTAVTYEDVVSDRAWKGERVRIDSEEVVGLLRVVEGAIRSRPHQPQFLPDTLIGILQVSDGDGSERIYFAADPEQARTQGQEPSPAVAEAVDAMYSVVGKLAGASFVRP